ncbi:NT-C2 domain-containing protein [Cephalotus follicularis]|uniref:NT-C2 domain-containing protein n=1 Tax=Cephalotus follicularis TaxID=3775 RepID=A0A1Q3CZZ8_CEPFO|nr:NT-C2 domain-containing protein [Cephalotus follicularis]
MVKWLPGQARLLKKYYHVKLKPMKLEGFNVEDGNERIVQVKIKWIGNKTGLVPFPSRNQKNYTSKSFLRKGKLVEWDNEFERVCSLPIINPQDGLFGPWDVSFHVLFGDSNAKKLEILGGVALNLAELASRMESKVEKKLPLTLRVDGVHFKATLLVSVSLAEFRSQDSPAIVQNSDGFFNIVNSLIAYKKKNKGNKKGQEDQVSSCESDQSAEFDSSLSPRYIEFSSETKLGVSQNLKAQSDPVKSRSFSRSKRRRLSFTSNTSKQESLIENDDMEDRVDPQKADDSEICSIVGHEDVTFITSGWEVREIVSRNGQAKLRANVFLASFDQRSKKAAGESACAALAAVIAYWLHSNEDSMPTRPEFDSLITEGSSLWQKKLCDNEAYTNFFPDKHFDLDTVLEAGLQPITIVREKSFTGFFSPEKFETLKEAMPFDQIWDAITSNDTKDYKPRVYIVNWNDHFFVLKVEASAYYVIDSFGERLFEGCNQAYILKFDESTLMLGNVTKGGNQKEENEETICSGKSCCKEYIKRFLAAIPLGELEEEENKGTVSTFSLLQRLQIDFNYCSTCSTTSFPCSFSS